MNIEILHGKLKAQVTDLQIQAVTCASDPFTAVSRVMGFSYTLSTEGNNESRACALIDSLDPLTAAFVISILTQNCKTERPGSESELIIKYAERLKHEGLEIKGLKGLCHARDEMYKKTGAFVI